MVIKTMICLVCYTFFMLSRSIYYVYIVKCKDGSFYTGMTKNVEKRLLQHNGQKSGGAKYTRGKRPVELRYLEIHASFKLADRRERMIKKFSHGDKQALCRQGDSNP